VVAFALAGVIATAALRSFSDDSTGSFTPVAFAASTPLLFGSLNPGASCEEIAGWVEAMRGRLPTTLVALSMYPVSYRRAIVGALTNDQKIAVWREHLRTFLSGGEALEPDQRRFIESVLDRLDEFFADARDDEALDDLQARSKEILGSGLATQVFGNLGPVEPKSAVIENLGRAAGIKCSCSTSSDWCGGNYDCYSGPCDATSLGCGTFLLYSCNGLCWDGAM